GLCGGRRCHGRSILRPAAGEEGVTGERVAASGERENRWAVLPVHTAGPPLAATRSPGRKKPQQVIYASLYFRKLDKYRKNAVWCALEQGLIEATASNRAGTWI